VASVSEMIQVFIPGRIGSIYDFLINLGGYLFAEAIIFLISFLIRQKRLN
jgi:VanZ family protein